MPSMRVIRGSQFLPPCPFCGGKSTEIISQSCKLTRPELFESQINCINCGARGTRYVGVETQEEAITKAVNAWRSSYTPVPGIMDALMKASHWVFTLSAGAYISNALLSDGSHSTIIFGFMVGSLAFGIATGALKIRTRRKREAAQRLQLKNRIEMKGRPS